MDLSLSWGGGGSEPREPLLATALTNFGTCNVKVSGPERV